VDEELAENERGAGRGLASAYRRIAAWREVSNTSASCSAGPDRAGSRGRVGKGVQVEQQLSAERAGLGLEPGIGAWVEVAGIVAVE
jgi:hypothetical protein